MKRKTGLSDYFPTAISRNPKKIIVLIVIFTFVMGYFASQMQMETREESFEPETEKSEWLDEIQKDLGRTGEAVQIAFVADDGDIFTHDTMEDMLRTKDKIIESEKVNQTLMSTDEIPDGVNTLADTVMIANTTLELEEVLMEQSLEISNMSSSMENQSAMYSAMYSSLDNISKLVYSHQPSLLENTTMELTSMANIISSPRSWAVLEAHGNEFYNLTENMTTDPFNVTKIVHLSNDLISRLKNDQITPERYKQPFIGLVEGMKNNTLITASDENLSEEYRYNQLSFLTFIQMSEYIYDVDMNFSFEADTPSLDMSLEDKKENLTSLSDEDIKEIVGDTINHDSEPIEESTERATEDLEEIGNNSEEATYKLKRTNETLTGLIGFYEQRDQVQVIDSLIEYKGSVARNKTFITRLQPVLDSMKGGINSATFIPNLIDQLGSTMTRTVSSDFEENAPIIDDIKAKSTISLVQMNSSIPRDKRREAQKEIMEISESNSYSSTPRVFAQQVMVDEIEESSNRSLNTLLPIAFVFVIVVLFIVYRTMIETVLSLLSLSFAIIWTFGFGVLLGYEFNPMIIAVPILITGLVIDYGIHMVMRYREEDEKGRDNSVSTMIAISTVGGALLLTSLTTAIGFLSNTFSNLNAMVQFGILAAVGITSSFILMVAFLPSVIQLIEYWRDKRNSKNRNNSTKRLAKKKGSLISSMLSTSADTSEKHPVIILVVVALITFSSVYGLIYIDTTFELEDFLPEDSSQSENIEYINDNFNVSTSYVYIMNEGDLTDPEYLRAVDRTVENARNSQMVRVEESVTSPLTVLRNYGMAVEGSTNYDRDIVENFTESGIPEDIDGWEDEIENGNITSDNITQLYDLLYKKKVSRRAISNVLYRDGDGSYSKGVIRFRENVEKINKDLGNAKVMDEELYEDSEPLRTEGYSTKITSGSIVGQETTEELTDTQRESLIATIIVVGVLLTLVFYYLHRSKILGAITTAPVALVTLWIIGTMYLMDVPLNVMTVSITALTVGMGIDYSIHITHRFTEEKAEEDNLYDAMHDTVQNTGAALFGSAATTIGAFAILSTSKILPLAQFGYITALAITYSFLVAVFVLPSILMVWAKCCKDDKREDLPILKKKH
ncbi:MAG: MMPL family transporter [Thermoplasmata archaeon]